MLGIRLPRGEPPLFDARNTTMEAVLLILLAGMGLLAKLLRYYGCVGSRYASNGGKDLVW